MIGPLPARYRHVVTFLSLLTCLGLAVWLASALAFPVEGYLIGVILGLLATFVLLHDFSRPVTEVPIDPS